MQTTDMTHDTSNAAETVRQERWLAPPCDIYESDAEWLINADVPGAIGDAINVHLDKNELTIEARRAEWFSGGAGHAGYRRVFTLPSGIDGNGVTAELTNGVVSVRVPKSEALKPRRIAIKTA